MPLRAFVPNAITALALCFGLTGVRFGITGEWAAGAGLHRRSPACSTASTGGSRGCSGRKASSAPSWTACRDNIAFGTAPALIIFLWSLQEAPRFGWIAALALAVCCALRLARFNARIDADDQPHKSAGFNTGVPAPVGAGLAFVPIYLWLISGNELFRSWKLVLPWTLFIALLMISQRADLHLVVDPHPPRLAAVRPGRRRVARRGVAQRALVDAAGDLASSIWRCCRSASPAMPGSSGGAQRRPHRLPVAPPIARAEANRDRRRRRRLGSPASGPAAPRRSCVHHARTDRPAQASEAEEGEGDER